MSTIRFLVRGRVQGVGFRWFVSRHARGLGVTGYARNLPDGTVEVVAHAADPSVLTRLEAVLASGPDHAMVDSVDREELSDPELPIMRSFDIR